MMKDAVAPIAAAATNDQGIITDTDSVLYSVVTLKGKLAIYPTCFLTEKVPFFSFLVLRYSISFAMLEHPSIVDIQEQEYLNKHLEMKPVERI